MSRTKKVILFSVLFLSISFTLVYYFAFEGINNSIEEEIQSREKVVLLFSASWCGSCNKLKPQLSEVMNESIDLKYYEIGSNLNKLRKKVLFEKYKVHGIPTLVFFKEGKEVQRLQGLQNKEELEKAFSSLD